MQKKIGLLGAIAIIYMFALFAEQNTTISKKQNLLHDALGAVAVSTEAIEALYVQALENSLTERKYVQVGAPWESGGIENREILAGLNIIQEPQMLFSFEKSLDFDTEIAFEDVPKKGKFKLTKSDLSEIYESLIFSEIKARYIDPKEFQIDLEEKNVNSEKSN